MKSAKDNKKGFTIVELLIVIVVIAILAAITIVAYNGIQQRANNSVMRADMSSVVKLIKLYHAEKGVYPYDGANSNHCVTLDNDCTLYDKTKITASNSVFVSDLQAYGNLPQTVKHFQSDLYGAYYTWSSSFTFNGKPSPVLFVFWLQGTYQDCNGISGAISVTGNADFTPGKYSNPNTGSGLTRCYEVITS